MNVDDLNQSNKAINECVIKTPTIITNAIFSLMVITAVTGAKVWVLDRRVFQHVMKKTGMQRIDDNVNFLRSVPLLENLSSDHMSKIADMLEVVSYSSHPH